MGLTRGQDWGVMAFAPDKLAELQRRLGELRKLQAMVLAPEVIHRIPPMHEVLLTPVWIDPDQPQAVYPTTYVPDDDRGASDAKPIWGLGKMALRALADAAGLDWDTARSGRTDDGSNPEIISFCAVATYVDLSGSRRIVVGDATLDLPARLEQAYQKKLKYVRVPKGSNLTVEQIAREEARKDAALLRVHGVQRAATAAMNRAISDALGLRRGGWTKVELRTSPFIVARLAPAIDWQNDPLAHRALVMVESGAAALAYGARQGGMEIYQPTRATGNALLGNDNGDLPALPENIEEPDAPPAPPPPPEEPTRPSDERRAIPTPEEYAGYPGEEQVFLLRQLLAHRVLLANDGITSENISQMKPENRAAWYRTLYHKREAM